MTGAMTRLLGRLGRFLLAQTEPSGAVLRSYDTFARGAGAGRVLQVLHGGGLLGLRPPPQGVPGTGLGRGGRSDRRLPGDPARRGRGSLAADSGSLGRLRRRRNRRVPRAKRRGLTEDEAEYAREQAELFGPQARWVAQRYGPWGELVRGSYTPRGGGYGVISEALTGWWLAAQAEPGLDGLRGARRRTRDLHRRAGDGGAVRRRGRAGRRPARAGRGRLVPRRRDPDGRPAARAGRAAADDPDRRGERGRTASPGPATTRRRAGCGPRCWCWR